MDLLLATLYTVREFSPVVPSLGIVAPQKGHKMDTRGHEMINGVEKKKEKVYWFTKLNSFFRHFLQSFIFCEIFKTVI